MIGVTNRLQHKITTIDNDTSVDHRFARSSLVPELGSVVQVVQENLKMFYKLRARGVTKTLPKEEPKMVRPGYPKNWKHIVKQILSRDGNICQWCGQDLNEQGITPSVDHVVSLKDGARDGWTTAELHDPSNLVAACRSCNSSRRGYGPPKRLKTSPVVRTPRAPSKALSEATGALNGVVSEHRDRPRGALIGNSLPSRVDPTRNQQWRMKSGGPK